MYNMVSIDNTILHNLNLLRDSNFSILTKKRYRNK